MNYASPTDDFDMSQSVPGQGWSTPEHGHANGMDLTVARAQGHVDVDADAKAARQPKKTNNQLSFKKLSAGAGGRPLLTVASPQR